MTIRELKAVIDKVLDGVPEKHDGDIRIWHGKKEYEVRAVSGYNVFLRLNIETGAKTYEAWEEDK
jgi:hypothetical protein